MPERSAAQDEAVTHLVDRAVQRDAEAFGALYDTYLGPIYRYLYYRLGNHAEAEDIGEQVFFKAWQAIDRFRWQDKPFSAWLYRLAHNAMVDHLRTRKHTETLDSPAVVVRAISEDWTSNQLDSDELARALGEITDEQRQVIILKFIEGLDNSEIAQVMDKREGAIRALQLRALISLRRVLTRERES